MTRNDLLVLTERLLNQLDWEFGTPEDKDHFVVLAEDPLAMPASRLDDLTVLSTWVDGEPVYTRP